MRKVLVGLTVALAACQSDAQALSTPQGAPKLLVVISVDQFSSDLFDEYRPHFTGGLARLSLHALG